MGGAGGCGGGDEPVVSRDFPKRLFPPAPIGSMLKRTSDVPQRIAPKAELDEDPDYLALVRQCPCLYCGHDPCGEAAHVRFACVAFGASSGMGKKPPDRLALPLCRDDHLNARHAQHKRNERAFWESLGINPHLIAQRLHAQRGDLVAMRAVAFVAISERGKR